MKDPLEVARYMAEVGIPIFLARPNGSKLGFRLPDSWEQTVPDPSVVDRWKPGMALCAVTGHLVDVIDVDPRNGGSLADLDTALSGELPRIYGMASTPSGGSHLFVASLGVRKIQSVVPGVDIQAGNREGLGRGFVFLAPTQRLSKLTGELTEYEWEQELALDDLVLLGEDGTGFPLADLVALRHTSARSRVDSEGNYDGPVYAELTDDQKAEADAYVSAEVASWRLVLHDAASWPEGKRDERGRGWEALAYQSAWAFAKMAACPWTSLDEDMADLHYHDVLPPEMAADESCAGKWYAGIVGKAADELVDVPPWVQRGEVVDDFGRLRPPCDATNDATVSEWLDAELGTRGLSGMFRRGDDLIHTPRVGEDGYVEPRNVLDSDGPAQVRRVSPLQLANHIDALYMVTRKPKKGAAERCLFPGHITARALEDLTMFPNIQDLRLVAHTPTLRADGTVLDAPGYDVASQTLYLPDRGLVVEPVPAEPSDADVDLAVGMLLDLVSDFPFVTPHDRANFLGCMMLPLMRQMVPPPYKLVVIGAPQRGSGKSLLAQLLRELHGGVFRSEFPTPEEFPKTVTSILDGTSAPVVQFDNIAGQLKSSRLDGLLTSAVWTDRRLGSTAEISLPNDRLWIATGNNVHIGGDLERRVWWVTIDADMEKPELRDASLFRHPDLEAYVRECRGALLRAMLVVVRAWVVAGAVRGDAASSDSFGRVSAVLRGVLSFVGLDGTFAHEDTAPERSDPEAEEWAEFLAAAHRVFAEDWWTTRELLEHVSEFDSGDGVIRPDELPGDVGDKLARNFGGATKSLGKWLSYRNGRWAGGLSVEGRGGGATAMNWHVKPQ